MPPAIVCPWKVVFFFSFKKFEYTFKGLLFLCIEFLCTTRRAFPHLLKLKSLTNACVGRESQYIFIVVRVTVYFIAISERIGLVCVWLHDLSHTASHTFPISAEPENAAWPAFLLAHVLSLSLSQIQHEVNHQGILHRLCSDECFSRFRSSKRLSMSCCESCGNCTVTGNYHLVQVEDTVKKFCSPACISTFKQVGT